MQSSTLTHQHLVTQAGFLSAHRRSPNQGLEADPVAACLINDESFAAAVEAQQIHVAAAIAARLLKDSAAGGGFFKQGSGLAIPGLQSLQPISTRPGRDLHAAASAQGEGILTPTHSTSLLERPAGGDEACAGARSGRLGQGYAEHPVSLLPEDLGSARAHPGCPSGRTAAAFCVGSNELPKSPQVSAAVRSRWRELLQQMRAEMISLEETIPWNAVKKAWRKARQAWRRSVTHGGEAELAVAMLELRRCLEGTEAFACDAALEASQSRPVMVPELAALWGHLRALVVAWLQARCEPGSPSAPQRARSADGAGALGDLRASSPWREAEYCGTSGEGAGFAPALAFYVEDDGFDSGAETEPEVGSEVTDMSDVV